MKKTKRNLTFDLVKGVAIIPVIIGHLDNCADVLEYIPYKIVHKFIYSFHMPLFFIVADFFFSPKSIYKDIKRLFYPYFFLPLFVSYLHGLLHWTHPMIIRWNT